MVYIYGFDLTKSVMNLSQRKRLIPGTVSQVCNTHLAMNGRFFTYTGWPLFF